MSCHTTLLNLTIAGHSSLGLAQALRVHPGGYHIFIFHFLLDGPQHMPIAECHAICRSQGRG